MCSGRRYPEAMGKAAHILLSLVLAALPSRAQTDAHLYSPGANLERSELVQVETATRSVDVAMYSFTDPELAEELATLAEASRASGRLRWRLRRPRH